MVLGRGPGPHPLETFTIKSGENSFIITEHECVKICGISFSNNKALAYNENILKRIIKLERQLDIWRMRNLTLEGKILIVKS